jgi:hypothetical protein
MPFSSELWRCFVVAVFEFQGYSLLNQRLGAR